ncbi:MULTISPECIES: hypothetical protein [unclassified Microbacterium]|uniref:hypothetical protein n=1 Tax=unclassified Microbacterium TaxID=2609290 RepID=UPI0028831B60|nr:MULTISPECIES: hypothetical protein [unclassified Microbacterium]
METPTKAAPVSCEPSDARTVELTTDQISLVIGALYDKLVETEGYLRGSRTPATPRPEHKCCPHHLAQYEAQVDIYRAMKARRKAVKRTIRLFERSGH